MRCDMVVAVGPATVDGQTLCGHNCSLPPSQKIHLKRTRGRDFALGEMVCLHGLELPQSRHTYTVLGAQPEGFWGYIQGLNQHGLGVGCTPLAPKLAGTPGGLFGTDLVRLTLERCRSARQGLDFVADLLGQWGRADGGERAETAAYDPALLLADADEAFVVESAGGYWAEQEIRAVRAVGEVRLIHQDWDRLAPGFAAHALDHGWCEADGTKLDFGGVLKEQHAEAAYRRWGRATVLLEQQNGHIDGAYLRSVLSDHGHETQRPHGGTLCQHLTRRGREATAVSLIAQIANPATRLPLAWCAFGPPCQSIYLPVVLDGDLPVNLTHPGPDAVAEQLRRLHRHLDKFPEQRAAAEDELSRLQARLDQDAEEFITEGAALKARGEHADLERLASAFLEHVVERFETAMANLPRERTPVTASQW